MPTSSFRTSSTMHRTANHAHMPKSTRFAQPVYEPPRRSKSPSPPADEGGPWKQTVNTYIWVEQQAEAQRKYVRNHAGNFTIETRVMEPDWASDNSSYARSKSSCYEKASFIDIQARAWMLQEEAQQMKAKREAERQKAIQEEIRRTKERIRMVREMERQRIAEERRRAYNNWKAYERRMREETDVSSAWGRYESRWASIASTTEPLTFRTIPWPVLKPPGSPESITVDAISSFLLSPMHSSAQTPRDRIKAALRRWHPDRFSRLLKRVSVEEKQNVDAAAGIVTRCLNELLSRYNNQTGPAQYYHPSL